MSENNPNYSKEIKALVIVIRDAFITLGTLLVAIIAFSITSLEWIGKSLSKRQSKIKPSSESQEKAQVIESISPKQDTKQDTKQIQDSISSIEVEDRKNPRIAFGANYFYPLFAAISTVTLVIGVTRLSPIADWASTQNECIERLSAGEAITKSQLKNNVKTCNGGHD